MMDTQEADNLVHAIAREWRSAPLSELDKLICAFAAKLTHHQEAMNPSDLEELRKAGMDDRAIHDLTQVVAYFNYITRIADALGVEPEDFIKPWGIHPPKKSRDL